MKDSFYEQIKNNLIEDEAYSRVKDYSKERHRVLTYYENGRLLKEAGKHYGENIIGKYADKLMDEVNKKYNKRTLFKMRQFYNVFNSQKVSPLGTLLTWSHYRALLSLKNNDEINYYIKVAIKRNLSKRQLEDIIKNKEYERLPEETKNKLIVNDKLELQETIPDPIIIKNPNNKDVFSEKVLHNLIIENISSFMEELGNGYSFIKSEYKIKIGERNYYIDLLLFNIEYNSYVVVELKVTDFKPEYMAQIKKYMNYIDINVKNVYHSNTIGIIVCKKENGYIIKYCYDDDKIAIREYILE